jgi:tetratricopeptide (TPR) repeat protein
MELTIVQALQHGVAAHKAGKLEEAERLYRAILKSQPAHPDANHNLGVIAVSVNKADAALPLFKTAVEANPTIEQFWLSYVDALIKEKQFDTAIEIFEQAKKQGVAGEKLNVLETQLISIIHTDNIRSVSPSKKQLSSLLELYQNGRFNDAEKLAISITQEFPKHQFGWKVLGAILGQSGRNSEAVNANQKTVALSPQDAEAHSNLGVTLKELGRLDEAEASLRQAIELQPDYALAHNNLGIALNELGRLDEAEASYTKAIELKPDLAEAYNNLGISLHELGRLEEAEASLSQAIELKPDYAEAQNNLGNTLQELGKLDEAEASYTQAISFKSDYAEAHSNLGITLKELGRLDEAEASLKLAIALKPNYAEAHSNLGIMLQELGRLKEAETSHKQAIALNEKEPRFFLNYSRCITFSQTAYSANLKLKKLWAESIEEIGIEVKLPLAIHKFLTDDLIGSRQLLLSHCASLSGCQKLELNNGNNYWGWLRFLLDWHDENYDVELLTPPQKTLYVIGDSHSMSYHNVALKTSRGNFLGKCEWIWGCKQFHLGRQGKNHYKYKFEETIGSLPLESNILLSIGEIDCRLDEGILAYCKKNPERKIQQVVNNTVSDYLDYILEKSLAYRHEVTIQGIPCPNIDRATFQNQEIGELVDLVQKFNKELKAKSMSQGCDFLNLNQITNDGRGFSNGLWHADAYHITPSGIQEAWRHHAFK